MTTNIKHHMSAKREMQLGLKKNTFTAVTTIS